MNKCVRECVCVFLHAYVYVFTTIIMKITFKTSLDAMKNVE